MANRTLSASSVEAVSGGKGYVNEPSVSQHFGKFMISVESCVHTTALVIAPGKQNSPSRPPLSNPTNTRIRV